MEKNLCVFSLDYLDAKTGTMLIGGVQTYIHSLCLLAQENGFNVTIYQLKGECEAEFPYDGIKVIIRNIPDSKTQDYFDTIYKKFEYKKTIFIISTDQLPIKSKALNIITIQHGIAFDIPGNWIGGLWGSNKIFQHINKLLRCVKNVMRCYHSSNTVCVDYNYYNWFRTIGTIYQDKRIQVIPNYSSSHISLEELNEKLKYRSKKKILFARRFCDYRGTLLFADVIYKVLEKYSDIEVTFAGSGPLEDYIRQKFSNHNNVYISSYNAVDSINFHKNYDIAVVPTIYSEGTSLSLLEAMSAGCFPLSTHVGGMTNIILDKFNGFLCAPNAESLYESIVNILDMNDSEFNEIVSNAYNSAVKAFSHNVWKNKWSRFIDSVYAEINKKNN